MTTATHVREIQRPSDGPDTRAWVDVGLAERAALCKPFIDARIPTSAIKALMRNSGYRTPDAVRRATDRQLLAIDNLGPTSLGLLRRAFPAIATEPDYGAIAADAAETVRRVRGIGAPRAVRCAACDTPYLLAQGHGVADCIRALTNRIENLTRRVGDLERTRA